jgi:S1-C subfamily serine protease
VRSGLAAACLCGLAALVPGCGDSASPESRSPRVVSVLGAGSERATGFVVGGGRVVTVAHAVESSPAVRVRIGGGGPRRASVLELDRRADLALLAVPGLRGPRLGTTTGNEGDARVLVLRRRRVVPVAAEVRRAIDASVSAPGDRRPLRRPALELDAGLRAGDSGAPVVTGEGELAGVVFARSRNHADTAYAVDARALERVLSAARRRR